MPLALESGVTTQSSVSTGSSLAVTLRASPTAGATVYVCGLNFGGTATSDTAPTDNKSSTYTKIDAQQHTGGAGFSIWYAKNVVAAITTVTFNWGAAVGGTVFVFSATGTDTTTPFITGEFLSKVNQVAGTSSNTGNVTNSNANSIFFTAFTDEDNGAAASYSVSAGWTQDTTNGTQTNTSFATGAVATQIVSASAATSATWTHNSFIWDSNIMDFQSPAAGGSSAPRKGSIRISQAVNRAAVF